MKIHSLLFLLLLPFSALFSQEIGFPIMRSYTTKEYQGGPQIWSVVQDKRGVMHFGVEDKIMEYDGVSWRFTSIDKQAALFDLAVSDEGTIYVAATDEFGYLKPDAKGRMAYQSLTGLIEDSTFKIGAVRGVKTTSKHAYFYTYDAVMQYGFSDGKIKIFKAGEKNAFYNIFVYKDLLYTQLYNTGLLKIENGELKPAAQSAFFQNKNRFKMPVPYDGKTLLIPTRGDGLLLYQPENEVPPIKLETSDNSFFESNSPYKTAVYKNKYFALGSFKKGVLLIDKKGSVLQRYNEKKMLPNDIIYEITADKDENFWIGLSNGISKTEHSLDLSYWDKNAGLKGIVYGLIRYGNTVYIATHQTAYFIDSLNEIQEVKELPHAINSCFLETKTPKSLLVGTSSGICEIKGDKAEQIYKGSNAYKMFQSLKNPARIYATDNDAFISLRLEAGKWVFEGKWEGIKDDIRGITEDENGDVWLGTRRNGVIRIQPDHENISKPLKIRRYGLKEGFASLSDILPFRYKNQTVWGSEKGLYAYSADTDRFSPFCGLGNQFCDGSRGVFALAETPDGKVWISPLENKKADIGYLQPDGKGGYGWVYAPFRRIPEMLLETFYVEPSGIAWIGGSEGVYRYDMAQDEKNYGQSFNCLIRKVSVGQDSLVYGGDGPANRPQGFIDLQGLEYRFNSLKFQFAAPFFDSEEKTLYSYKLEGFDENWSAWGRQTEKEYSYLEEGSYAFKAKAKNIYGIESPEAVYALQISPPWYRTWWAFTVYLIAAGFGVYIVVKLYTRRLIQQQEAELKKQEEELIKERAVVEKLKQIDKIKDEFMANTSHELRTPLNGIIGLADSLLDGVAGELPKKAVFNLNMITASGKRLASLIDDILDFGKMRDHKLELQIKALDLFVIAEQVMTLSQPLARGKDLVFVNAIEHGTPLIAADENRLQQVLFNLIGNAVKFTQQGSVEIGIAANNRPSVPETEKGKTIVYIKDTGIGIEEKNFEKIFLSFEQGDGSTGREYGGTGLGLSVSKQLVELHGGKIWVESVLGTGSTFFMSFDISSETEKQNTDFNPMADSAKTVVAQTDEIESAQPMLLEGRHFNILIVDDEPVNLQVLENHLSMYNYSVIKAENGFKALEVMENGIHIDLAIVDIMMPKMSGYEVCKTIRQKHDAADLPIIMLTAKNQIQDLVTAFEAGANDYLVKPFNRGELLARIKTHLKLLDFTHNLEHRVLERTEELNIQREEIQAQAESLEQSHKELLKSYQDIQVLGEIGKKITATLDFSLVLETVYQNVNVMMTAEVFGIGLYYPEYNEIEYRMAIEKGLRYKPYKRDMADKDQFPVWCIENKKEVFVNDVFKEYPKYLKTYEDKRSELEDGTLSESVQSIIYLPLIIAEKVLGIITVQSFQTDAYQVQHLTMLQSLATYIAIAVENANSYGIIETKNKSITDSIRYAETIQRAILPNMEETKAVITSYFVLYKPKDIVSGDFYWCHALPQEGKLFVALADCTGHGVPGGFMSMIGASLLDKIVKVEKEFSTDIILERLDTEISRALHQKDGANNDGMDIAFCLFEKTETACLLSFTGAKRNLMLARSGENIEVIKGDNKPIGGRQKAGKFFTKTETSLPAGSRVYMSTDGFADQSGMDFVSKIGSKKLTDLLQTSLKMPIEAQKGILESFLNGFQNGTPQKDDIAVMGIEV